MATLNNLERAGLFKKQVGETGCSYAGDLTIKHVK